MSAGQWDISVERGSAFRDSYQLLGSDGNPLNLTACTAALQVRVNLGDPNAILTLTTGNGGLTINGAAGTITPIFDTSALAAGIYVYDLKLYDSGGNPDRVMQGSFIVIEEVTTI